MPRPMPDVRKGFIKKVHVAKGQMGMDDEQYRNMLMIRYGVDSSTKLSVRELSDLMNHFIACGWKQLAPKRVGKGQYKQRGSFVTVWKGQPLAQQKKYILALWEKLGWDPTTIHTRCRKQFGVDKFEWLEDPAALQTLAKDLWNRCNKRGLDPRPQGE